MVNFIDSTDNLKLYEEVKDNLKFIYSSTIRTKIIISLTEGTTKLEDLKKELDLDASTILHAMKKLENKNLIYKEGNEYFISQTGIVIGLKLIDIIKLLFIFKENQDLIFDKDIPLELLLEFNELKFSNFIMSQSADLIFANHFYDYIIGSKNIRGIPPICDMNFIETSKMIVENGKELEIILTPKVIKEIKDALGSDVLELITNLISDDKIKIWTIEQDLKLPIFLTDNFIFLGFSTSNGKDFNLKDMISHNSDAIDWGNRLFDSYLKDAQRLKI